MLKIIVKPIFHVMLFTVIAFGASQVPGFVYKYQTVLEGNYMALEKDFLYFSESAKKRGVSLNQHFIDFANEGPIAKDFVGYKKPQMFELLELENQRNILFKEDPYEAITLVFSTRANDEIFSKSWELFHFETPLSMSQEWFITVAIISVIGFVCIRLILILIFKIMALLFRPQKSKKAA